MQPDSIWQDLRCGARTWRSHRDVFLVALVALALGIGANTTIFSVVEAVLLRPLPYRDAGRLIEVFEKAPSKAVPHYFVSSSDYFDYAERSRTLEHFAGYWRNEMNLSGDGGEPQRVAGLAITHELLATLGLRPILGRDMTADDRRDGAPEVALITEEMWRGRYGSAPDIVGRGIAINGQSTTIIGVLPAGVHFAGDAQVWNGLRPYRPRPTPRFMEALARLRPGVSLARAQAEMNTVAAAIAREFPDTNRDWEVGLRSVPDQLLGGVRPALVVFLLSVGLLLAMACANVANLLLAQAAARRREVALRAALGATAGRLMRQFLTESILLGVTGGVGGVATAVLGVRAVRLFGPADIPRLREVALNPTVLLYALALSLLTGVLFGIAPVLGIRRPDLVSALKASGRGYSGSRGEQRWRSLLVIVQVSLAVVLATAAGLLIKSFSRLMTVNPGFQTARVLTANIALPRGWNADGSGILGAFDRILPPVKALPGVRAAGTATSLPLAEDLDYRLPFRFLSLPAPASLEDQTAWHRMVSPGLFAALNTPLIAGRDFDDRDGPNAPGAVIVNQALVRQYWPRGNPLGQKIRAASGGFGPLGRIGVRDPEVVGVVSDIRYSGLGKPAEPAIYFCSRQAPFNNVTLVVRTDAALTPEALISAVRQSLRQVDPSLPLAHIRTLQDQVAESVARPHFQAVLLSVFSGMALLLGSIGIYGVLAYSVARRRQEIGIRTALGGRPRDIQRMILGQALRLVAIGLAVGIGVSLAAGRLLETLLFEVKPADPANYLLVCAALTVAGLIAGYWPARTAARIDPGSALRDS